jgi:hypothetical protein
VAFPGGEHTNTAVGRAIVSEAFVLYFLVPLLQDHVSWI